MNHLAFDARSEADTARLGAALAAALPPGTVVALCGTLGAGKTRLVQAIAEAAGVDRRDVLSPTFVLMQEYRGRRTVCHIDAYRLRDEDEFLALGADEFLDADFEPEADRLTVIEWADRVRNCLPRQRVDVNIEVTGPQSRRFEIAAADQRLDAAVARLRRMLENPAV